MLRNWPPPGTEVRFVRSVRLTDGSVIPAGTRATLTDLPLKKAIEEATDKFRVRLLPEGRSIGNIDREDIE